MSPLLIALIVLVLGSVFAIRAWRGRQVSHQLAAGKPVSIQVQVRGKGSPYTSKCVFARLTRTTDGGVALFRIGDQDRTILIEAPGIAIKHDEEYFDGDVVAARDETMWGFECVDCAGRHLTLVVDGKMADALRTALDPATAAPTQDRKEVTAAREGRVPHTSFIGRITPLMWGTLAFAAAVIAFTVYMYRSGVTHVSTVQSVQSDGSCLVAYHSTLKDMPAQDYLACPAGSKVGDQITVTEYPFIGAGNMSMFRDQIQAVAMGALMIALSFVPFLAVAHQRRKGVRAVREVAAPSLVVVRARPNRHG
jgi:hypothetical protein